MKGRSYGSFWIGVLRTALVETRTTELREDDPENNLRIHERVRRREAWGIKNFKTTHQPDRNTQQHDLLVPPELLAAHRPCSPPERRCLVRHLVRLVDEQLDALATGQDLLDVLHHDVLNLRKLALRALELVDGRGGVVRVHELRDDGPEGTLEAVCGYVGDGGGGREGGEPPLELSQEGEWHATIIQS